MGRIIVVNLVSLRVVDDFQVTPLGHHARDVMYADLCWFQGEHPSPRLSRVANVVEAIRS